MSNWWSLSSCLNIFFSFRSKVQLGTSIVPSLTSQSHRHVTSTSLEPCETLQVVAAVCWTFGHGCHNYQCCWTWSQSLEFIHDWILRIFEPNRKRHCMNYDENFWTDSRTPLFRVVLHLGCCKCSFIRGVVLCWALKQMCFSWDNSWLTWISESIFFCVDSLPRSIVFLVFEQHWSRASSRSGHISCFAWDFSLQKWWHNVARILQCLKLLQKIQSRMAVMFYVIIFSFWCWLISKSWPFKLFILNILTSTFQLSSPSFFLERPTPG